jgi:endonuclease/exonuclease/phosphatase (EEP) superfamily protein YafD
MLERTGHQGTAPEELAVEKMGVIDTDTRGRRAQTAPPVRRRWVWPLLLAVAPWLWFAVRRFGPELDLVAIFFPAAAVAAALVCALNAALRRRLRYAVPAASFLVCAVVAIWFPRTPHATAAPVDPFVLVSANVFIDNPTPSAAARSLADRQADVLVLVEATQELRDALTGSLVGYAHATRGEARGEDLGELDIYSRWPLEPRERFQDLPKSAAFAVTVDRPGAPFGLVAVHLPNPLHEISFPDHLAMTQRLLADAHAGGGPVVLAGDFNTSDRTHAYGALTTSTRDAMRTTWAVATYGSGFFRLLALRIDYVLEPPTWCSAGATTFEIPGSDHRGVSVSLGTCPR